MAGASSRAASVAVGSASTVVPAASVKVQELFHDLVKLLPLLGQSWVDSMVIDHVDRLFEPLGPAVATSVLEHKLTDFPSQGRLIQALFLFSAA
jgi:hypothetical protein